MAEDHVAAARRLWARRAAAKALAEATRETPGRLPIDIPGVFSRPQSMPSLPPMIPELAPQQQYQPQDPSVIGLGEPSHPVFVTRLDHIIAQLQDQTERIGQLRKEIATKEDLIAHNEEVVAKLTGEASMTRAHAERLWEIAQHNLVHVRASRYSLAFLVFFLLANLLSLLGVEVIQAAWNLLGIIVSAGFYGVSVLMKADWKRKQNEKTA